MAPTTSMVKAIALRQEDQGNAEAGDHDGKSFGGFRNDGDPAARRAPERLEREADGSYDKEGKQECRTRKRAGYSRCGFRATCLSDVASAAIPA